MKIRVAAVLLCTGLSLFAGELAQVRFYCTSLRFQPGSGGGGGTSTITLSSDSSFSIQNGELRPTSDASLPGYASFFQLADAALGETLFGQIAFDPPPPVDENKDGFDDFYDSSQNVSSTTMQGIYETPVDTGTVRATWSRAAGSAQGTCRLRLSSDTVGDLGQFSLPFELLEYRGTLEYAFATNLITGLLSLTNTTSASLTWSSAVSVVRVATNRHDVLNWLDGVFTNSAGLKSTNYAALVQRDESLKTNYFGFIDFDDGDPATSIVDYPGWVVSIDDPNDADQNGIPDLSDDPLVAPSQLALNVVRVADQLEFSIKGEIGFAIALETSSSVARANWSQAQSVTLTNSPQLLQVPLPNSQIAFWRLRKL